jgi:DNA ligase (NAD+)
MDVEHLGEKTVAALIEAGKLHDAADIYRITAEDLAVLGGFKDRSIANLLGAIEASKQRPLDRLLVGPTIATSVAAWFADEANQDLVGRLVEAGVNTKADGDTGTDLPQTLAGMSFVLTGGLDGFTREQATQAIEDRGGRVAASVSKKTGYVVVGTDPGAKAARAAELGVPTLDEPAFAVLLERGPEDNRSK